MPGHKKEPSRLTPAHGRVKQRAAIEGFVMDGLSNVAIRDRLVERYGAAAYSQRTVDKWAGRCRQDLRQQHISTLGDLPRSGRPSICTREVLEEAEGRVMERRRQTVRTLADDLGVGRTITWEILRDDFMMGQSLKDWDKESDSEGE